MVQWFPNWLFPLSEGAPNMSPDLCHVILRPLYLTHICSGFQLKTLEIVFIWKKRKQISSLLLKSAFCALTKVEKFFMCEESREKTPGGAARWAHVGC